MKELDWQELILHIESHCLTDRGKDWIHGLKAFSTPAEASLRQTEILQFMSAIQSSMLNLRLHGLDLVQTWIRRAEKNQVLNLLDLKDLRVFLEDLQDIKIQLKDLAHHSYFAQMDSEILDPDSLLSYIDIVVSDNGEIRSDASETLFKLFNEKKSLNGQVKSILNKIVKDQDLEGILQDRFVTTREGRWVLPVISGMRHDFGGIIHDSSQSKQTVFMEPQAAIPVNNKISEIENKIQAEIERILKELSEHIHKEYNALFKSYSLLQELDGLNAVSHFAVKAELKEFKWSEDGSELFLPECRNPLLVIENPNVVANGVELNKQHRILILSGPNAGGKTVLLKSIGLACEMARWGWPVCTQGTAVIPFFKNIFISIGDEQNIEESLSSFGGHLKKLNQATVLKGQEQLLLIDEICGATEAQEGAALARAFIEEYRLNGVFGVVTSHLAPLKSHWSEGVINGSMQYDPHKSQPTFRFVMGLAGESLAIPTAKRYGVSPAIIERAKAYLTPEAQRKFSGLEEIENAKTQLIELQSEYKKKLQELNQAKDKLSRQQQDFENDKKNFLKENLNDYQKQIEGLIKFDEIKSKFDNIKNLEKLKGSLPNIVKYSSANNSEEAGLTLENFEKRCPPGTSVYVKSLKKQAIVQGKPNAKQEVAVLSQSMHIQVPISDIVVGSSGGGKTLSPMSGNSNFKATSQGSRVSFSRKESFETERTVDLRGKTIDEALDILEEEVDRAIVHQLVKLKIIHGHGPQDRLKKSVRTYLSRNTLIKGWLSGKAYNESDGVTIAELLV